MLITYAFGLSCEESRDRSPLGSKASSVWHVKGCGPLVRAPPPAASTSGAVDAACVYSALIRSSVPKTTQSRRLEIEMTLGCESLSDLVPSYEISVFDTKAFREGLEERQCLCRRTFLPLLQSKVFDRKEKFGPVTIRSVSDEVSHPKLECGHLKEVWVVEVGRQTKRFPRSFLCLKSRCHSPRKVFITPQPYFDIAAWRTNA